MKNYKIILLLNITPFFISSGVIQNKNVNTVVQNKWNGKISNIGGESEIAELSIADTRIVEGNAGQRQAEVIATISQVRPTPVTVIYSTRNGTAQAGSDYVRVTDSITFAPGDIMMKISIPVNGDIAIETDETFKIALINLSTLRLADSIGMVTIINDDFKEGKPGSIINDDDSEDSLGFVTGGNFSVYEVRFSYTGYTTFHSTPSDCPIRSNGSVVLTGLLAGAENVADDDDIRYTGTLQLDMNIDICSAMTVEAAGGGYPLCGITVIGSGAVKTELEIYFDGRGGYIKNENTSGRFLKSASGSCDRGQINEERNMIPNKTIASVFNGRDLPMLTQRTLRLGRYVERDGGIETVVEVLRVVRR